VFEDDLEIKRFLETMDHFSALHIDQDLGSDIDPDVDYFLNNIVDDHIFDGKRYLMELLLGKVLLLGWFFFHLFKKLYLYHTS